MVSIIASPTLSTMEEESTATMCKSIANVIYNDDINNGTVSHESTSSGECLPPSRSTDEGSTEQSSFAPEHPITDLSTTTTKLIIPEISLVPIKTDAAHTIVCREWKTESVSMPQDSPPALSSTIPEKDAVLWLVKDFSAFRSAAKVSQIPPLVSPEFGGGCRLRLWLYEKKGHIVGSIELPMVKASRDGVAHFRISVVRPDLKAITLRKVEMRITNGSDKKLLTQQRTSATFKLTQPRCLRTPKYENLVIGDCLRVRVEFEYFPFDAPVFRGFGRTISNQYNLTADSDKSATVKGNSASSQSELLNDIRNYCRDDPSQNVEIRRDDTIFNACRFLLCSRSKRFRDIFGNSAPLSARGSPSRFGPFSRSGQLAGSSLSSVTIQDITAETVDQLLTFIHTDTCPWVEDRSTDILKVLDLFEAADLYGVEALIHRLVVCLSDRMDNDNFVFMYDVAERCTVAEFKRLCTEYMDSLPGSQVASLMRVNSLVIASPRTLV